MRPSDFFHLQAKHKVIRCYKMSDHPVVPVSLASRPLHTTFGMSPVEHTSVWPPTTLQVDYTIPSTMIPDRTPKRVSIDFLSKQHHNSSIGFSGRLPITKVLEAKESRFQLAVASSKSSRLAIMPVPWHHGGVPWPTHSEAIRCHSSALSIRPFSCQQDAA
jgi:hypothetical protein